MCAYVSHSVCCHSQERQSAASGLQLNLVYITQFIFCLSQIEDERGEAEDEPQQKGGGTEPVNAPQRGGDLRFRCHCLYYTKTGGREATRPRARSRVCAPTQPPGQSTRTNPASRRVSRRRAASGCWRRPSAARPRRSCSRRIRCERASGAFSDDVDFHCLLSFLFWVVYFMKCLSS